MRDFIISTVHSKIYGDKAKKLKWWGLYGMNGDTINSCEGLVVKSAVNRPLEERGVK